MKDIDVSLNLINDVLRKKEELVFYLESFRRKPESCDPVVFEIEGNEYDFRWSRYFRGFVLTDRNNEFRKLDFMKVDIESLICIVEYVRYCVAQSEEPEEEGSSVMSLDDILNVLIMDLRERNENPWFRENFVSLCNYVEDYRDFLPLKDEDVKLFYQFIEEIWKYHYCDWDFTDIENFRLLYPKGDIDRRIDFLETCLSMLRLFSLTETGLFPKIISNSTHNNKNKFKSIFNPLK